MFKHALQRVAFQRPTVSRALAHWNHVEMGPKDPIFGLTERHNADPFADKINVGVGAYRTDEGKPWVLPSVVEAQNRIIASANHEYAPIIGVPAFLKQAKFLAYGEDSRAVADNKIACVQSLSGTGALRLSGEFMRRFAKDGALPTVMLPNPTWGNHNMIYAHSGLKTSTYRYWHPQTLGLDLDGMLEDLKNAEGPTCVLLHACAHNPTGVDPTLAQWKQISDVIKDLGHFVIFDNAYQGFASGDLVKDRSAIDLFQQEGHLFGLCQSFAKNFGLYGQRAGTFSVLCEDENEAQRVQSQLAILARGYYSNPPLHGARIVATVLEDPELQAMWKGEITVMANRIIDMRTALKDALEAAGSQRNWDHITSQIGMFSYTGLTGEQCDDLVDNHHIYLTRNGRISMAGVNSGNVGRLAESIHKVTN